MINQEKNERYQYVMTQYIELKWGMYELLEIKHSFLNECLTIDEENLLSELKEEIDNSNNESLKKLRIQIGLDADENLNPSQLIHLFLKQKQGSYISSIKDDKGKIITEPNAVRQTIKDLCTRGALLSDM